MDERRSKISLRREDSDDSIEEKSGIRVFSTKRFDQVKESDTKKEYLSKPTKSQPKEDPRQNNPSHEKNSEKINENVTTESLPHLDGISVNTDLIPENIKFSKIEERRDDCDSSKLFRNKENLEIFAETKEKRVTFEVESECSDLESTTKEESDNLEAFENNLPPLLDETSQTKHLEIEQEVQKIETNKEKLESSGNNIY